MILTVTLNPAIDVTYHVDALTPGSTHRVSRVDERLGGKGINVAGVLAQLEVPVVATGLLRDGPESFTPIAAAPRRTVVVADGADATGFWEPGPIITPAEWAAFNADFECLVREAKVVVFSGSLPGGLPDHAYASLIGLARSAGCLTILDTSGPALRYGMLGGPTLVKPNTSELSELPRQHQSPTVAASAGADRDTLSAATFAELASRDGLAATNGASAESRDALTAAALAGRDGIAATTVVASAGVDGLTAAGWRARPPVLQGNPTGAGDACVAALARGLLRGTPWPELLRDAAALSAAAVASPVAGQVDLALYESLLPQVIVEEI